MANIKRIFKYLVIIPLVVCSSQAKSQKGGDLLKCLGREELKIHKKKLEGPVYKLNQQLIGEISSVGSVPLKRSYLKKICDNSKFSPSVQLLRVLLIEGTNIVHKPSKIDVEGQYAYASFKELVNKAPMIFFAYLADLQAMANYPHCLNKKVPEIKYYIDRYRYLQAEYTTSQLLDDKKKLNKVFTSLTSFDDILRDCKVLEMKSKKKKR